MFAPDAVTVIDSVSFGHQPAGYTLGRAGHAAAWALTQPSLGAENTAVAIGSPSSVYLCEWFANGEVAYEDDFVELCNPSPLPVDLSGFYLTDNPNSQPVSVPDPAADLHRSGRSGGVHLGRRLVVQALGNHRADRVARPAR